MKKDTRLTRLIEKIPSKYQLVERYHTLEEALEKKTLKCSYNNFMGVKGYRLDIFAYHASRNDYLLNEIKNINGNQLAMAA